LNRALHFERKSEEYIGIHRKMPLYDYLIAERKQLTVRLILKGKAESYA